MANKKIAQLTNKTTLADTDIIIVESATATEKMTVENLKTLLGIKGGGIEENGSTPNGYYVKYKDGTMICRNIITLNELAYTATANDSLAKVWNFPTPFTALDYSISICKKSTNVSKGWKTTEIFTSPNLGSCYLGMALTYDGDAFVTGNEIVVSVMAVGWWK